jgi:hypothetical protein
MTCSICSRPLSRGNKSGTCTRCQEGIRLNRPKRPGTENQTTAAELDVMIAERMATMPQGHHQPVVPR